LKACAESAFILHEIVLGGRSKADHRYGLWRDAAVSHYLASASGRLKMRLRRLGRSAAGATFGSATLAEPTTGHFENSKHGRHRVLAAVLHAITPRDDTQRPRSPYRPFVNHAETGGVLLLSTSSSFSYPSVGEVAPGKRALRSAFISSLGGGNRCRYEHLRISCVFIRDSSTTAIDR